MLGKFQSHMELDSDRTVMPSQGAAFTHEVIDRGYELCRERVLARIRGLLDDHDPGSPPRILVTGDPIACKSCKHCGEATCRWTDVLTTYCPGVMKLLAVQGSVVFLQGTALAEHSASLQPTTYRQSSTSRFGRCSTLGLTCSF
jgi:hypothetical protein